MTVHEVQNYNGFNKIYTEIILNLLSTLYGYSVYMQIDTGLHPHTNTNVM